MHEQRHEISNNVVSMCDQQSLLDYSMSVKFSDPTSFLSFKKGGCTGLSESILVKMPHCLKSHVAAQIITDLTTYKSK